MTTWSTGANTSNFTFGGVTGYYLPPTPVSKDPLLQGDGPPECSSCTELSVLPVIVWDVNGYYRELGVPHDATRKQLRSAYQGKVSHLQNGDDAARLTYILSQLLNPEIRFQYDCCPLGMVLMDDYVIAAMTRKAKDEASRRMQMMADMHYDLSQVEPDDVERGVWEEMGIPVRKPEPVSEDIENTPDEVVDQEPERVQDDQRPAKFEYSFYLWKTRLQDESVGLSRLADWQRLLVSALSREGVSLHFAVGFHGDPHRWIKAKVGYRTVFFLNTDLDPTQELADLAARFAREDEKSPR